MARRQWKLTLRHGPSVSREEFDRLDDAVAALDERSQEIRSAGPLPGVKAIRDYDPGMRINARLELSRRGLFRAPTAGIDVMGDGRLVPYAGAVRRRELDVEPGDTAAAVVERALRGSELPGSGR